MYILMKISHWQYVYFSYRFITQIVKRSIYSLKVSITMANCSKEKKTRINCQHKSKNADDSIQCNAIGG